MTERKGICTTALIWGLGIALILLIYRENALPGNTVRHPNQRRERGRGASYLQPLAVPAASAICQHWFRFAPA